MRRLYDYESGAFMREATNDEAEAASIDRVTGSGAGTVMVEGVRCYVGGIYASSSPNRRDGDDGASHGASSASSSPSQGDGSPWGDQAVSNYFFNNILNS